MSLVSESPWNGTCSHCQTDTIEGARRDRHQIEVVCKKCGRHWVRNLD